MVDQEGLLLDRGIRYAVNCRNLEGRYTELFQGNKGRRRDFHCADDLEQLRMLGR